MSMSKSTPEIVAAKNRYCVYCGQQLNELLPIVLERGVLIHRRCFSKRLKDDAQVQDWRPTPVLVKESGVHRLRILPGREAYAAKV